MAPKPRWWGPLKSSGCDASKHWRCAQSGSWSSFGGFTKVIGRSRFFFFFFPFHFSFSSSNVEKLDRIRHGLFGYKGKGKKNRRKDFVEGWARNLPERKMEVSIQINLARKQSPQPHIRLVVHVKTNMKATGFIIHLDYVSSLIFSNLPARKDKPLAPNNNEKGSQTLM